MPIMQIPGENLFRNMANRKLGYSNDSGQSAPVSAIGSASGPGYQTGQFNPLGAMPNRGAFTPGSTQGPSSNPFMGQLNQFLNKGQNQETRSSFGSPSQGDDNRFEKGLSTTEKSLSQLMNDPNAIQNSAAYQFRLKQGQEALQRQMGARGMLASGNRLTELTKYGQDMASQEYDNQFSRLSDLVGKYGGLRNQDRGMSLQDQQAQQELQQRGNIAQGQLLANLYGTAEQSGTQRYGINVGAQTASDEMRLKDLLSREQLGTQRDIANLQTGLGYNELGLKGYLGQQDLDLQRQRGLDEFALGREKLNLGYSGLMNEYPNATQLRYGGDWSGSRGYMNNRRSGFFG